MSFANCASCGHEFTNEDGDIPHADGGFMEVNHGGGQCKACYLESGHWECPCGTAGEPSLMVERHRFCHQCGRSQDWIEKPDFEVEVRAVMEAAEGLIEAVNMVYLAQGRVTMNPEDLVPIYEALQAYRRARGDE
jgi:hypothetical protein